MSKPSPEQLWLLRRLAELDAQHQAYLAERRAEQARRERLATVLACVVMFFVVPAIAAWYVVWGRGRKRL